MSGWSACYTDAVFNQHKEMASINIPKGNAAYLDKALKKFTRGVQKVFSSNQPVEQRVVDALEEQYRELYQLYLQVDENIINETFAPKDIKLINFLSLGKGQLQKMYKEVATYFEQDADRTAIAVAHFVKSRRAYDLVNKTTRSNSEEQELAVMFGSLLGVKVTTNFVKSMRAEEMGRIIGYALSGLCESDMKQWNDSKTGKALKKEFGSLDQYLISRIRAADKWASFRFEVDQDGGVFRTAFKINEYEGALDRARGRNLLDHCFIRHNPNAQDGEPKGVITVGTSTSQILAEEHGFSFSKAVLAAEAMTREPLINGEPNPYYGYQVKTYCFFSGHSPTTDLEGNPEKSELVKMLEGNRAPSQPGLTMRQITELGWLPFMSLFAGTNPSPLLWHGLKHVNPMISGCDTEKLYEAQTDDYRQKKEYSHSRRLPKLVLEHIAKMTSLLAQDNVKIDLSSNGAQKVIQPMLEFLLKATKNHFKNFPIMPNQTLSKEEERYFGQIATGFKKIHHKIAGTVNRQDLAGEFDDMSELISEKGRFRKRIQRDVNMCAALNIPAVFDESLYQSIDALRHYDTGHRLDALRACLKKDLSNQEAGPLFSLVFEEVDKILAEVDKPSGELLDFWSAYKDCLIHALDDGRSVDWIGGPDDSWDWGKLKDARTRFLKEMSGTAAEKFVRSSIHLISQRGPTGGNALSDRIGNNAMAMELRNISKSIVAVARGSVSDILAAKIRNMVEESPANAPAQRRRSKIR